MLRERGFQFYDVRTARSPRGFKGDPFHYHKNIFNCVDDSFFLSRRLWEFDVIFLRNPKPLLERRDTAALRRLIVCYCVYFFFADAMAVIAQMLAAGLIDQVEAHRLEKCIVDAHWSSHLLTFVESRGGIMGGLRRLLSAFLMQPKRYWARHLWSRYPNA